MTNMRQGIIEEILKNNSISNYLISKGVAISRAGRYAKCICPLHQDNKPSFIIYDNPNGIESFYCFGCKRGSNFISLYAAMEKISFKDAIKKLAKGVDLSNEEEIEIILRKLKQEENDDPKTKIDDLFAGYSLSFGALGYSALSEVQFNNEMIEFLEQMYKMIDKWIREYDLESLENAYLMLTKEGLLKNKVKNFQEKQEKSRKMELEKKINRQEIK